MNALLLAALVIAGYLIAYHTYGKFLAKKIRDKSRRCVSESGPAG